MKTSDIKDLDSPNLNKIHNKKNKTQENIKISTCEESKDWLEKTAKEY
jgi:hypothetical protein